MFYQPESFLYLWMVPVAAFLCLPVLFTIIWLAGKPAFTFLSRKEENDTLQQDAESRIYERIQAEEIRIDVSDGKNRCTGLSCNISQVGICIMGLPDSLYQKAEHLSVIIRDKENSHRMRVKPVWEQIVDSSKRIGASIETIPAGWPQFVLSKAMAR